MHYDGNRACRVSDEELRAYNLTTNDDDGALGRLVWKLNKAETHSMMMNCITSCFHVSPESEEMWKAVVGVMRDQLHKEHETYMQARNSSVHRTNDERRLDADLAEVIEACLQEFLNRQDGDAEIGQTLGLPGLQHVLSQVDDRSVDAVEKRRRQIWKINLKTYRRLMDLVNSCAPLNPADDKMLRDAVGQLLGAKFHLEVMKERLQVELAKYMDGRANLNREIDELTMVTDLVECIRGLIQEVVDRQNQEIDIRPDPPRPRNVPPPTPIIGLRLIIPTAWFMVVALAIWLVMGHV
ncbi:hypothetical protein PG997_010906 [Apiospora hydei]|uniref:Uncharacterized protein n=1 Tax=Apiospora hydei TaxID=1337664 RepID=A0ABR1VHN0_9PEZI